MPANKQDRPINLRREDDGKKCKSSLFQTIVCEITRHEQRTAKRQPLYFLAIDLTEMFAGEHEKMPAKKRPAEFQFTFTDVVIPVAGLYFAIAVRFASFPLCKSELWIIWCNLSSTN